MVKVKADRKCKISRNSDGIKFSYVFEKDEIKDVSEKNLNFLLDTGIISELSSENNDE